MTGFRLAGAVINCSIIIHVLHTIIKLIVYHIMFELSYSDTAVIHEPTVTMLICKYMGSVLIPAIAHGHHATLTVDSSGAESGD